MPSQRITRTEYRVPGSGLPRLGATTHAESDVDLVDYVRPLEQVHASAHGSGVVEGFAVTAAPGASVVQITPGVAVDVTGRHISLAAGGLAEISADPELNSQLVPVDDTGVDMPTGGRSGSCAVSVTWRETFDQELFASSGQKIFQDNQTPWLRLSPAGDPPDERVVLATVNLDDAGVVQPDGLTAAGRSGPTPSVAGLRLSAPASTTGAADPSVSDLPVAHLQARPGGGVQLQVSGPAGHVEFAGDQDTFAEMSVAADRFSLRRADGTEPILLDPTTARLGIGTNSPSHALHITDNQGLRQNALFVSGTTGWSSVSYNAHHNEANNDWTFPDPSRPAVTVEMDDANGTPRFQVWTTTSAAPTAWNLRLSVDGNTGLVQVPGGVQLGGVSTVNGRLRVRNNDGNNHTVDVDNGPGNAVCATSDTGTAVGASAPNGTALLGVSNKTALSTLGPSSLLGNVDVSGTLHANQKNFLIDHPLDPANRYLRHTSVESSERTNVYTGNVTVDAAGEARVRLPEWFEALNTDFRYQLTPIGGPATVYIKTEIQDGEFTIAGGTPGLKVSWQVIGVRNDTWAQANPLLVEEDKPEGERGFYRHPRLYGRGLTESVYWARHQDLAERHRRVTERIMAAAETPDDYPEMLRFLG
jgi:hypothetical protein